MTRLHVQGAAGYAAAELLRLMDGHPFAELGVLESQSHAGEPVASHFAALPRMERRFDAPGTLLERVAAGDCVVLAGAGGTARELVAALRAKRARIIDLSADFRSDAKAVYGFPERYRAEIAAAQLVANPGCYPTATLLAVLPLSGIPGLLQIIVDAKSGSTGAGRTPAVGSLFAEVSGEIRAYGLSGHRHEPEIGRQLDAAGIVAPFVFTPHVVPIARGMLADVYCLFADAPAMEDVRARFARAYEGSSFVRVVAADTAPRILSVVGTNDAQIHLSAQGNVVRAICAIDNLGKGAAGQAVQNFNIMYGYPEETALDARRLVA